VVGAPPRAVVFRDVAVIHGVTDRTVNELSSKISVPGVAESLGDNVNEHVVKGDGVIAPPRHGTRGVKIQFLDRCIRGLARSAVTSDDAFPRFARSREEVGVVLGPILEPVIGLAHGPAEDWTEVTKFDERQVLDDPEEVGPARNKRATDVVLREPVQLPDDDATGGLQVVTQNGLHDAIPYVDSERISRVNSGNQLETFFVLRPHTTL